MSSPALPWQPDKEGEKRQRKRVRWTRDEEKALGDIVQECNANWAAIAERLQEEGHTQKHRTPRDCRRQWEKMKQRKAKPRMEGDAGAKGAAAEVPDRKGPLASLKLSCQSSCRYVCTALLTPNMCTDTWTQTHGIT